MAQLMRTAGGGPSVQALTAPAVIDAPTRDGQIIAAHDAVAEFERLVRDAEAAGTLLVEPPIWLLDLARAHAVTASAITAALPDRTPPRPRATPAGAGRDVGPDAPNGAHHADHR